MDEPVQILCPQLEGPLLLGTGGGARGQFLLVAGGKARQNTSDEHSRLPADVAVGQE